MTNPQLAASILAATLALAFPLTGPLERKIYRSDPTTPRKLMVYGATVVALWTLTAVAAQIDGWRPLLVSPAAVAAWLPAPAIVGPVLGVAVTAFLALALLPLAQSLRGPRWRRAYAAAVRRNYSDISGFLPNNATERWAFILISLTAGVCEEVLFRGFLIRFLRDGGPAIPLIGALALSSAAFGLGHLYQGFKGVMTTTVAGIVFGLLFLLTGSLIPGIVLHALVDAQMVYVLGPIPEGNGVAATELA